MRPNLLAAVCATFLIGVLAGSSSEAAPIGIGDFVSPTIEEFEGLALADTVATPLVINGTTYIESGGFVRYFSNTDAFLNCFGGCLTTNESDTAFLDVVFSSPVTRAGLFVGAFTPWTATAQFFDSANVLFGTTLLSLDTGGDVFTGWENAGGILRIRLIDTAANLAVLSIDRLHLETVQAAPEPATLTLLGLGLAGAAARRRRTRHS